VGNDSKDLFNEIENKSSLKVEQIYDIAHSIQHIDFSDEATVRQLVRQLTTLTNRTISQDKEDSIVQSIVNNDVPQNMQSLKKYLK